MMTPPLPADEDLRLATLHSLQLLDTERDERFDRVTRLARRLFDVPIALVSLVDTNRQWFKSCEGLEAIETARAISFCGHAILGDGPFVVPDAAADVRFADNPLVIQDPRIRFYAACPVRASNGCKIGTLCIIDRVPRLFGQDDLAMLGDLAGMVEREIAAIECATIDVLTGLTNRRGFESLAAFALASCARTARPASLIYFDLEGLRRTNDVYGRPAGDRTLVSFARLLSHSFRASDVVARIGGDEFVVLATGLAPCDCDGALERFAAAVDARNQRIDAAGRLAFSAGIVTLDAARHRTVRSLLDEADAAAYAHRRLRAPLRN